MVKKLFIYLNHYKVCFFDRYVILYLYAIAKIILNLLLDIFTAVAFLLRKSKHYLWYSFGFQPAWSWWIDEILSILNRCLFVVSKFLRILQTSIQETKFKLLLKFSDNIIAKYQSEFSESRDIITFSENALVSTFEWNDSQMEELYEIMLFDGGRSNAQTYKQTGVIIILNFK